MADFLQSSPNTYFDRAANKGMVGGKPTYDYNEYLRMGGPSLDQPGSTSTAPTSTTVGGFTAPVFSQESMQKAIDEAIQRSRAAVQPQIESLQASIPEISSKYGQMRGQIQSEIEPLKQKYDNLIASIKGKGTQAIQQQTKITSGELGKRGILGSSTLAQQELASATQPIEQQYAGLESQAVGEQAAGVRQLENTLAGLAPQETADMRAIQNAIAALQSGAVQTGTSLGSDIYKTGISAAQQTLAKQIAAAQAQRQAEYEQARINLLGEQTGYKINKPYYAPKTGGVSNPDAYLNNPAATTTGWTNAKGEKWTDTTKEPVKTFTGKDGKTYTLYSDGSVGSTIWNLK